MTAPVVAKQVNIFFRKPYLQASLTFQFTAVICSQSEHFSRLECAFLWKLFTTAAQMVEGKSLKKFAAKHPGPQHAQQATMRLQVCTLALGIKKVISTGMQNSR